jgi:hypothetical protein
MSTQTATFTLTPVQFQAAKDDLQKQYKITISGDTFDLSGWGTTVTGSYDGVSTLNISAEGIFAGSALSKVREIIAAVTA